MRCACDDPLDLHAIAARRGDNSHGNNSSEEYNLIQQFWWWETQHIPHHTMVAASLTHTSIAPKRLASYTVFTFHVLISILHTQQ